MKKLWVLSFMVLAALSSFALAQDDQNPRRDKKTPTIPAQQQSGWDVAFNQLSGKLQGADVTRTDEGIAISFKDNVLFETGSAVIRKDAHADLNSIAKAISSRSDNQEKVRVTGRADSVGETAMNQKLSEKRAEAVSSYLVSKGVAKESLVTKAYGETKPVASNKTEAGRQKNRSVDITLLN